MIIVTGKIEVSSSDEIERVRSALVRRAEKSRADEGCLDYVFSVAVDKPTEIRLFEVWESEELLDAHLLVPDEEFNQMLAGAAISSARVVMHEVAESRELMAR